MDAIQIVLGMIILRVVLPISILLGLGEVAGRLARQRSNKMVESP